MDDVELAPDVLKAVRCCFDRDFYLKIYPDVATAGVDPFHHYLTHGRFEKRKASALFDPASYLDANPEVAVSGIEPFLHYALIGRAANAPRSQAEVACRQLGWDYEDTANALGLPLAELTTVLTSDIFDRDFYLKTYPDVATAGVDPFHHYLTHGRFEKRKASALFDPASYLDANPEVAVSGIEPFLHYALIGRAANAPRSPIEAFCRRIGLDFDFSTSEQLDCSGLSLQCLIDAAQATDFFIQRRIIEHSGLFDKKFYRRQVPWLKGRMDPIAHYMIWGYRHFLDPSSDFSGAEYYLLHEDVRSIKANPLLHYIVAGRQERRHARISERDERLARIYPIKVGINLAEENTSLECMRGAAYLCRYGLTLERNSNLNFAAFAISDLVLRKPRLSIVSQTPEASIIIPVYGQLPALLNCLDSLAIQTSKYTIEIIVVDDASPSESQVSKIASVPWIRDVNTKINQGFISACNHGASCARGRFFIFLNSDTRVVHGWLDELIGSFNTFPKAGLIGSKLINDDLTLQEAGGILWRDGTAWNFGRGDLAWRPEYSYAREVDYCSGASIAVRSDVWSNVDGFDKIYFPAYFEDTDLAFRVRRAGFEVWLQPLSLVVHYEGKTHGRDLSSDVKAYQIINYEKFYQRWRDELSSHGVPGNSPICECNRKKRQRILVIDLQTPTIDRDLGSINTYEVLRLFLFLGWHVSFVPRNFAELGTYTATLQRIGVEVLIQPGVTSIDDIFRTRPDFYDVIFAFRVGALWDWYECLKSNYPKARIVFHDIDLHYLRLERKANLLSDLSLRIEAELFHDRELELIAKVDCSVVVTNAEKVAIEKQLAVNNIIVFPYTINTRRSERSFGERRHLCFVGSYGHDPNVDAVLYFVNQIWPLVRCNLPLDAKFLVVGPDAPWSVRRLASDDIVVTGHIEKLEVMMDDCRVR